MSDIVFVSMPFGDKPESPENEWTKLFDHGLKPLEEDLEGLPDTIQYSPIKLWRADRNLRSLGLKSNVMRGIEHCNFLLGVLTTSVVDGQHGLRLSNPNVLWELGYAEALGKPIVVLADNDSLRQLPVLAGLPNVCVYNHKIVQDVAAKDAHITLKTISRDLAPFIVQASDDAKRGQAGFHKTRAVAYPSRDAVRLATMIANARRVVDVLTTNIGYFLSKDFQTDSHPFASALQNGATVRIVTMDPESVIAEYRARQLVRGQDIPGYRRELRESIVRFFEQFGDEPQFHLHIYNDLPLQITTRVDETIITSIVTRGERARERIQVQFNLYDEGVTDSFVSHFQSMFEDSNDVRGIGWVLRDPSRGTKQRSHDDTHHKRQTV